MSGFHERRVICRNWVQGVNNRGGVNVWKEHCGKSAKREFLRGEEWACVHDAFLICAWSRQARELENRCELAGKCALECEGRCEEQTRRDAHRVH